MAGTHKSNNTLFSSNISSPGYVESIASSNTKTKETLRTQELIPSEILENSGGVQVLLDAYYKYMNLQEFIYQETETYEDVILDNRAVFRVNDPRNENDHFFTDDDGANSTLTVRDSSGNITTLNLGELNVSITNGNNLPGSLADSTSDIGKTFTVTGFQNNENSKTATLITPVKYWAGPGASYALNTIEESMDIDSTAAVYLELIQKEIAAVVPRSIQVNKRNLYKAIVDYYKIRGSADSIEVFFRLLFDDEVEVEYPWDETLIPSSGNWEVNASLPKGGIYLDKKGFLSDTIKIQDSLRYQKFSYLIRTGQNLSSWNFFYERLVHPAGFKYFAEILIQLFGTRDELGDDQKIARDLYHIGGPNHNLPTGESFTGYGRTNRFTLSSMPDLQPGVIGIEDIPLLVKLFASSFLPFTAAKIHSSARLALTVDQNSSSGTYGKITSVEIVEGGFGYSTAPTVVVNGVNITGQSITTASITTTLDSQGKVISASITNAGGGYSSAFANTAANPNISKLANLVVTPNTTRTYSTPPTITFTDPTSLDSDGNLASTNVTATAKYILKPTGVDKIEMQSGGSGYSSEPNVSITGGGGSGATARARIENGLVSFITIINPGSGYTEVPTISIAGNATAVAQLVPSEVASTVITNPGFGYIFEPFIYLGSKAKNENRVKEVQLKKQIELNHTDVDPEFNKVTNPVQTNPSVRGRTLYNGSPLKIGVLTSGQNWTITQSTPASDKAMGGYNVNVIPAGYRTKIENNYYNQKTNILESGMLYDFNETLEVLGDVELQSTSISDINKYNVNSFIHNN
jgi:hypothetical protein